MSRALIAGHQPPDDLNGQLGEEWSRSRLRGCRVVKPRPDHRSESAGAVRPAGLAGVPSARLAQATESPSFARKVEVIPRYQVVDSVEIYKYRPYAPGGSKVGFIAEYVYSFLATALATVKARRHGTVRGHPGLQPAGHLLADRDALPRLSTALRFVFDHHDLCPELYLSRFPDGPGCPTAVLLALERRTHRAADHVISTNDSYRDIAIGRSGKATG